MAKDFYFTDLDIRSANWDGQRNGFVPLPEKMKNDNDHFRLFCWNLFFNLVLVLKKELRKKIANRKLSCDKNTPLFSFAYQEQKEEFVFSIHQQKAAQLLSLPEVRHFKDKKPLEIYTELVCHR